MSTLVKPANEAESTRHAFDKAARDYDLRMTREVGSGQDGVGRANDGIPRLEALFGFLHEQRAGTLRADILDRRNEAGRAEGVGQSPGFCPLRVRTWPLRVMLSKAAAASATSRKAGDPSVSRAETDSAAADAGRDDGAEGFGAEGEADEAGRRSGGRASRGATGGFGEGVLVIPPNQSPPCASAPMASLATRTAPALVRRSTTVAS